MSKSYRKIYETYHCCSLIPGIDIHHIDGNHANNDPLNLKAVTLQEHYMLHKAQKDFYAAFLIGIRMKIKPEDWLEMAKANGRQSGKSNYSKGIGLKGWIDKNPELYKAMVVANGKKSGKLAVEQQTGIHGADADQRKQWSSAGGNAASDLGLGFKLGHASSAGKIGGKKGGLYAKENKTGIFALTSSQIKEKNAKGAITKMINSGRACAWPKVQLSN